MHSFTYVLLTGPSAMNRERKELETSSRWESKEKRLEGVGVYESHWRGVLT